VTAKRRRAWAASGAALAAAAALSIAAPSKAATYYTAGVVVWGDGAEGIGAPPEGLTNVVAVAAGAQHSVALVHGGTVVVWGGNDYGQLDVPAGLSDVVYVSASTRHTLAAKSDGTVVGWGDGHVVPPGLTDVVAVAAGSENVALKSDGTVVAWRHDGTPSTDVPDGLSGVIRVASSTTHNLVARNDGTVVTWGAAGDPALAVPPGLNQIWEVAAGESYSLAVTHYGTIVAWGDPSSGVTTVPAAIYQGVHSISAGPSHDLAVTEDGQLFAWGSDEFGQISPPPLPAPPAWVAAGSRHSVLIVENLAPSIEVPPDMVVKGDAGLGGVVDFEVTVTDPDSKGASATCVPASGSVFPLGTTVVTCTATDGNKSATAQFSVLVGDVPGPPGGGSVRHSIDSAWVSTGRAAAHGSAIDTYGAFLFDAAGYTGTYVLDNDGSIGLGKLETGHQYYAVIVAHNRFGWGQSTITPWFTPGSPTRPSASAAVAGDGSVHVAWKPHPSTAGVDLYVALAYEAGAYTGKWALACGTCKGATIFGLTNGKEYTVRVHARNAAGLGQAIETNSVTAGTPLLRGLKSVKREAGSATIEWHPGTDNGAPIDAHLVLVFSTGGAYTGTYALVCGTCTQATITGLGPGYYQLVVYAHNARGLSAPVVSRVV
jgi:hypothetical protein